MLMRIIGAMLSVATVLAAIALWRFSTGPVSLDFLAGYVQEMLTEATPGYAWKFDQTILDWTNLRPALAIGITGVEVRDKSGDLVGQVPRLDISLSARALLTGRLAPTEVEVEGASLAVVRLLDGRFRLGLGAKDEPDNPNRQDFSALLSGVFAALLEPPGQGGNMGALERLTIRNVALVYNDLRLDSIWQASGASLAFYRSAEGITGEAAIDLIVDDQTWALSVVGNFDRARQQSRIDVSFSGIEPFRLAAQNEKLAALAGLRLPLSGNLGMMLGQDGQVISLHGDVRSGPGEIMFPDFLPQVTKIDTLEAAGEYALAENLIRLHRLHLNQNPLDITAAGTIEYGVESPAINIKGDIVNANIAGVKQLWPVPLAKGSRSWFMENIDSGVVDRAHFEVSIANGELAAGPMTDAAIKADLQFSDVIGHYLRPMPPMTKARGSAIITGRQFELNVDEAVILDDLAVSEGKFILLNTHLPNKDGEVRLVLNGSVTKTLQLIDSPPLGYPTKYGMDPPAIAGDASTRLLLKLPIKKDMHMNEIHYEVTSDIHALRLPGLLNGAALEAGEFQLQVNPKGIEAKGAGRFLDVETNLTWREKFNVQEGVSSQFSAQMTADEVALEALGFPTAGIILGPVGIIAEAQGRGTKFSGGRISGDLRNAELVVEPLSWKKPKGTPATIRFDFSLPPTGAALNNLTIAGKEIDVSGRVTFAPDGPPELISFERLKLGPVNDLTAQTRLGKNGVYDINLNGKAVDFTAAISQTRGAKPQDQPKEPGIAYKLNARVKQVTLREGNILNDVIIIGSNDGKKFNALAIDGNYGEGQAVTLRLGPDGSGDRPFKLLSLDAGKILYGLNLFDSGIRGDFEMEGKYLDSKATAAQEYNPPMQGTIRIRNMQVVNAPVLTRILTVASLTGISDILTGSGLTFDRIKVPFKVENNVITVSEAYASGSEVGLTLGGTINQAARTTDMSGTVIPAYTLNTVLGKVPVLGKLLLGGANQGVFAINYSATGDSENPDIFVNPLSALTPGFLRKIFDLGDGAADAETPDASPAPETEATPPAPPAQ